MKGGKNVFPTLNSLLILSSIRKNYLVETGPVLKSKPHGPPLHTFLPNTKRYIKIWSDPVLFNQVPNYFKIIKQPMDLKKVKRRLQLRSSQYYRSIQEFVSDMRLIFKNCADYNEVSGMNLEPAWEEWHPVVCVCMQRVRLIGVWSLYTHWLI